MNTILVEHDITVDLYTQLLRDGDDFDLRLERDRWERFELDAWKTVDCVAVMSAKDHGIVRGAKRVAVIENGVDLQRFRPASTEPEAGHLLFIGTFAHLPNLIGLDWFLHNVWPKLSGFTLHVIAGRNAEYFTEFHSKRVQIDLKLEGVTVDGYVSDVRAAYEQAEIVIAPLLASAGTNIKVIEAMACGKAIVSTPGGVNGLAYTAGENLMLAEDPAAFAAGIVELHRDHLRRRKMEQAARKWAETYYGWEAIGAKQLELYQILRATAE